MNDRSGLATMIKTSRWTAKQEPMTKEDHPSYENPTIAEALCEIHFELSADSPWQASSPGDFYREVQDDFPKMEPINEVGLVVEVGPHGVGQKVVPGRSRTRYVHKDKPLQLQLSEAIFTINMLPKYPGWDSMKTEIEDQWGQAISVLKPAAVTRIGLRYINKIPRSNASDTPGDWLKENDYVSRAVLRSLPGGLSRSQIRLDEHNRLVVTLADQAADSAEAPPALVFDIDRIVEERTARDPDKVLEKAEEMHDSVWEVFKASMSPKLEALLKEGSK